jgi:hypothetical protein
MIGTLRKHSKWLWAIIITATILSFVIWGSQSQRYGEGRGEANLGSIAGQKIKEQDFVRAYREVVLDYFFKSGGQWPDQDATQRGFDANRQTYFRLLLLHKLAEMKIEVSDDTVARTASDILRNIGRGNPVPLDEFVKKVLLPHADADDFARYIKHEIGVQELVSVIGVSGKLVTPQEARALYERQHREVLTDAVFFSASNYLANVKTTPEALSAYWTNFQANYRVPERVQVSYVRFDLTNFLADVDQELAKETNLTQIIEARYQERGGTNYYRDAKSPEEAKEKIRQELRMSLAERAARKKASEFASPLFDLDIKRAEDLDKAARTNGLTSGVTKPFSRQLGPPELEVSDSFAKTAFALTPENPFGGPVLSGDTIWVMALQNHLASEIPPFESVRERVTSDYQFSEAVSQARNAGMNFVSALTNGMAQGKSFDAISAEANVKPVTLPAFSISSRSVPQAEEHVRLDQLKEAAFSTPPGKASGLVPTRDGAMVLFVKALLPIDEAKAAKELPDFLRQERGMRQNEAFNEWFSKEAQRALRDTPVFQQASPQMKSAAAGT